jgi:hypothetical protein
MADKKLLENSQNMLQTDKQAETKVEAKSLDTMKSSVLSKANIFERSVVIDGAIVDAGLMESCPSVSSFHTDEIPRLTESLAAALPLLKLKQLDELKLQYNAGSKGCFPMVTPYCLSIHARLPQCADVPSCRAAF